MLSGLSRHWVGHKQCSFAPRILKFKVRRNFGGHFVRPIPPFHAWIPFVTSPANDDSLAFLQSLPVQENSLRLWQPVPFSDSCASQLVHRLSRHSCLCNFSGMMALLVPACRKSVQSFKVLLVQANHPWFPYTTSVGAEDLHYFNLFPTQWRCSDN